MHKFTQWELNKFFNRLWPIEIKWTTQLRSHDLKQISKYKNGIIYAKVINNSSVNNIPVQPLPLALLHINEMSNQ